jgi:hypothetical protein
MADREQARADSEKCRQYQVRYDEAAMPSSIASTRLAALSTLDCKDIARPRQARASAR